MTIVTNELGKAHIIKLVGRLDAGSTSDLDAAGEKCIGSGALYVVLDLAELQYISSAGLGTIVKLYKKVKAVGGTVTLCGVRGMVKEVFEVTGLFAIFKVFDSPEAASQNV